MRRRQEKGEKKEDVEEGRVMMMTKEATRKRAKERRGGKWKWKESEKKRKERAIS